MRICLAWLTASTTAPLILLGSLPVASEPAFRSGFVGIPVPTGAEGLFAADFDHDGDKDLAVACRLSDVVSVLLLASNGDVDSRVDYPVGDEPRHVVAADLDLDGNLDLISANYGSDAVSVLRGDSNGRFMPRRDYPTDFRPVFVVVSDANGDRNPDLMVSCQGANSVALLFGAGDGTFQRTASITTYQEPSQIVAGDLNGDDMVDLIVASLRRLSVYLGVGHGYFQHSSDYSDFTGTLALRDLDVDGNLDLVVSSDLVRVLRGNGNGDFSSPTGYRAGSPPAFSVLDLLDDDPWPDLALANQFANRITILWGLPGGAFEPATDLPGGHGPAYPVIADFTGDGRADIATTGGLLLVSVFEANGDRTFGRGLDLLPVGPHARSVSIVDTDGDGTNEIASIGPWSWNELVVRHQNGNGGFEPPWRTPIASSQGPVAFADLDTDGRLDLVSASNAIDPFQKPLLVQLGTGGGAFGPATALPVFNSNAFAVHDFDRDGRLDILAAGDRIDLAAGHGDGSFEVRTSVAVDARALAVDDLNADGVLDAVVVGRDGPGGFYRVLLGNGAGTFIVLERHATVYDPIAVGLGHLDDDEVLDLVIASREFNHIGIHRGIGAGDFEAAATIETARHPSALVVNDLDRDGRADIAVACRLSSVVTTFTRTGTGWVRQDFGTDITPGDLAIGDLNGDLLPDLATYSEISGSLSVLFNSSSTTPVAVSDFDALRSGDRIRLRWRVAAELAPQITQLDLQSATVSTGHFETRATWTEIEAGWSEFEDQPASADDSVWYRLRLRTSTGSEEVIGPIKVAPGRRSRDPVVLHAPVQEPDGRIVFGYTVTERAVSVSLGVLDVRGRFVWSALPTVARPGTYRLWWDSRGPTGAAVARGIYFVHLRHDHGALSQRFTATRR